MIGFVGGWIGTDGMYGKSKKKLDEVYSIHRRQIEIRKGATVCPHRGKLLSKCRNHTLPWRKKCVKLYRRRKFLITSLRMK